MYGLYVNDKEAPFTEWIMNGTKTVETRNRNTLGKLVGKDVWLIRTGQGEPVIVGKIHIDWWIHMESESVWIKSLEQTRVKDTSYEEFGNGKWCYGVKPILKFLEPIPLSLCSRKSGCRSYCIIE